MTISEKKQLSNYINGLVREAIGDVTSDGQYYVYATDREKSELVCLGKFNTERETVVFVKSLVNRNWNKNYRVAHLIDKRVEKRGMYKVDRVYLPYVELTITNDDDDSLDLIINTDEKTISYYDVAATNFYPYVDEGQDIKVKITKPWDEKLALGNM